MNYLLVFLFTLQVTTLYAQWDYLEELKNNREANVIRCNERTCCKTKDVVCSQRLETKRFSGRFPQTIPMSATEIICERCDNHKHGITLPSHESHMINFTIFRKSKNGCYEKEFHMLKGGCKMCKEQEIISSDYL